MLIKIIILCFTIALVNGNCDPCPDIPKHYEELGCIGIKDNDECCPTRNGFECPDFSTYDLTKCIYKGRSYDENSLIDDNDVPKGVTHCKCSKNNPLPGRFNCIHIDCPGLFDANKNCVKQYSHELPCFINAVCDQNEIDKLHKCYYQDKIFHEAELINPSDDCYRCLCNENYDNSTKPQLNANCKKGECYFEFYSIDKFKDGCVPVYYDENTCCPTDYKCPSENDKVVLATDRPDNDGDDPSKTCKFGSHILAIGDSIDNEGQCDECKCVIPPMLSCMKKGGNCKKFN